MLARLEAEASEPERDLNSEVCSTKPEAAPSAPVRALKSEVCSAMLETEPIEALKFTVRPLKKEAAKPNESDRDLNSEVCSTELAVGLVVYVTLRAGHETPLPRDVD